MDGPQPFVVPSDVCRVTIDAFGAQGASSDGNPGGLGRRATASIVVTPGEVLQVNAGGAGDPFGVGGFNGGGDGGAADNEGSGGGGASDVRRGSFGLADRLVVAGGGGGSGDQANTSGIDGGAGGGATGVGGDDAPGGAQGGAPGTESGGGAAGGSDVTATAGALGQGGQGGTGADVLVGGGGGGGGRSGGGGGAGESAQSGGGGGGGGSGFGPAGTLFETGVRAGDGIVTATYDRAAGTCGAPPAPVVIAPVRFTG